MIKKVVKSFLSNHCSMYAAGLTYFSMLAVVPMLCVLLIVARMFHAEEYVQAQINSQIEAAIENIENGQDDEIASAVAIDEESLESRRIAAREFGKEARELSNKIFSKIQEFNVGKLGWIGFMFLVWTVISSLGTIEVSFNEIWGIPLARPIWKKSLLYFSLATILPVLGALAMSIPILNIVKNIITSTFGAVWLTQWVSIGLVYLLDSWVFRLLMTLLLSSINFAFIFYIMPNCRVKVKSALKGGLVVAILFGGWMKVCAIAQVGIAKASALYGSFAFFPILLAWIYMSWQIVLLGACIVREFDRND